MTVNGEAAAFTTERHSTPSSAVVTSKPRSSRIRPYIRRFDLTSSTSKAEGFPCFSSSLVVGCLKESGLCEDSPSGSDCLASLLLCLSSLITVSADLDCNCSTATRCSTDSRTIFLGCMATGDFLRNASDAKLTAEVPGDVCREVRLEFGPSSISSSTFRISVVRKPLCSSDLVGTARSILK